MGGDRMYSAISAPAYYEPGLSSKQDFPHESVKPTLFSEGENDPVIDGESLGNLAEYSPEERQGLKAYAEVLRSYEELRRRSERLAEGKSLIFSYTPGSWIEEVGGMNMSDYDVPKTTTLLLIGPKGAGKSSLVNRISRVLEGEEFLSDRAQVSYDKSVGDGTYFLQEYLIPRVSGSFCLYDTRSLSDDYLENQKMIEDWMMNGVRHGELLKRESDSSSLQEQLKFKAQKSMHNPTHVRKVNFVIFVVNGLSVLEAMDDDDTRKSYTDMIAATFNNPLLSFKDDKPVVVVTHGDLLSLCDRATVRVHLGKLLGVPPTRQIFDIPESNDSAVSLTTVDMLIHSLEHAERNLPGKDRGTNKVSTAERCSAQRNHRLDDRIIFLTTVSEVLKRLLTLFLLLLVVFLLLFAIPSYLHARSCHSHSHSHSSKIHLDKMNGSIPNKVDDTGGAYFHSHSSEIQFEEVTWSTPNKRNETGEANIQPPPSEIHLDGANGLTHKGRKETERADFQPHSSKEIHLDEATGSTSNERKEAVGPNLDEATGSTSNERKEAVGPNFQPPPSEIHLDEANRRKETIPEKRTVGNEATESASKKMKKSRKADFQTHSSKIRLDEATGSSPTKRKEIIRKIRKETSALDTGLNWFTIRHIW